jgi:hypothetical protein
LVEKEQDSCFQRKEKKIFCFCGLGPLEQVNLLNFRRILLSFLVSTCATGPFFNVPFLFHSLHKINFNIIIFILWSQPAWIAYEAQEAVLAAVKKQASWGDLCLQNLLSASHKIPTSPCNQVIY